jgi:hypothetical protein
VSKRSVQVRDTYGVQIEPGTSILLLLLLLLLLLAAVAALDETWA